MIDYSVYMTPNPMDEGAAPMAYGRAQMRESMTFDKFVKHIAEHNGVFSRGTVQGVILDMCECLVEMLLDGKKVQLGALGDFFISLSQPNRWTRLPPLTSRASMWFSLPEQTSRECATRRCSIP